MCSLQTVQGRWKPEKGSGERRRETSSALSSGTSGGVVICISTLRVWVAMEMGSPLWLKERLRKGMLEKYWDSHLRLARDVNLTPRVGRGR